MSRISSAVAFRLLSLLPVLLCLTACGGIGVGEARFTHFSYSGHDARFDRQLDPRHEFFNPVLSGFNSDPSICRKGDDYFIITSSFTFWPSIPLWHSRDLVHWQPLGSVIETLELDELKFNRGVYAADISYNPHNDTFYVVNTCVDGIGNFVVKSRDPFSGEWSAPIVIPEAGYGIDPSFFFDEDGRAYLLHNDEPEGGRKWSGHQALYLWEYDTERDCVVGERTMLLDGGIDYAAHPEWLEGPRIYRRNGKYILLAAEGGTYENHSQVALVSDNVRGPYVPCPDNPILTQRDLPEERADKVTCTGHADLVDTPDGRWFILFHGCRPYDGNHYNTGREAFLLPVEWRDGFPSVLARGEAVPTVVRMEGIDADSDIEPQTGNFEWDTDFSQPFDARWMMIRNPRGEWWQTGRRGLILKNDGHSIFEVANPAFVGVRQQHTDFDVETEMIFTPAEGEFAGLALFQNEEHNLLFGKRLKEGRCELVAVRTDGESAVAGSYALDGADTEAPVRLRVSVRGGSCDLEAAIGSRPFTAVAEGVDIRNLSTHTARGFNGVIVGLYAGAAEKIE